MAYRCQSGGRATSAYSSSGTGWFLSSKMHSKSKKMILVVKRSQMYIDQAVVGKNDDG